jgi:hypothetical protein
MSRARKIKLGVTEVISLLTIVGVIIANVGYADPIGTQKVLEDEGYTDIVVGGRQYFGCDRNFYRTQYTAKNSRGIAVHGLVCKSIIDGAAYIKRT